MMLCSVSLAGPGSRTGAQSPPRNTRPTWSHRPTRRYTLRGRGRYLGWATDGRNLGIKVWGFRIIFHDKAAGVVEQRLTVDCVFDFHHLLQVAQLEALSLVTSPQKHCYNNLYIIYMYMSTCTYIDICTHIHIYIHKYMCIYIQIIHPICIYTQTLTHIYIFTYIC